MGGSTQPSSLPETGWEPVSGLLRGRLQEKGAPVLLVRWGEAASGQGARLRGLQSP